MAERCAKRFKPTQCAPGFKPALEFKELNINATAAGDGGTLGQWSTRAESEKFSAHADLSHNLYVSDTTRIMCFAHDGSCRPVVTGIEPHHIVPNATADYVVILRKSDKRKLSKVTASGEVSTILEAQTPLYGPDVCTNGDIVHHPSTSRLERRSPTGELTACIEGGKGRVISFEANSYLTAGQDGHVYFSSKTCVYRWNTHERTVECIAGHPKTAGRRDGFGCDARFTHLKRPTLTRRFAYVRESDNRFCRIDLQTFEVMTLQLRGLAEHNAIETYGVTPDGHMMFIIFTVPFRIFMADTSDAFESTFLGDMRRLDWTGASGVRVHVEFVAGKDRHVYRVDGRILEARSAYFRSMLSSGMREASDDSSPIDLGEDVSGEALGALFQFLHTDHFEPVSPPSRVLEMQDDETLKLVKLALEVHSLADRFLLPRLVRLCEVFLANFALRSAIVLPMMSSITSPRRPAFANLEAACWEFLEENWKDIVQNHGSTLQELVNQKHPLAVELLQAAPGVKRIARKVEEDAPASSPLPCNA